MALLEIWADTRGQSACRSCGAPIEWAEMVKSGKRMPFNGEIVPVRSEHRDGRLVEIVDSTVTTSHFSTCKDAKDWRRR